MRNSEAGLGLRGVAYVEGVCQDREQRHAGSNGGETRAVSVALAVFERLGRGL